MEANSEIGGYFELELCKGEPFHKGALRLNSGRNSFEYILRARKYAKVYLPYYTCEVMFDTATRAGVEIAYYHVNEQLEPEQLSKLKDGDAFLYTNYYGIKQKCVERLAQQYGQQLIVDNAQAFYAQPLKGIDTFYSPHKFFGVSDGGYLYTEVRLDDDFPQAKSMQRMTHLLKRIEDGAEAGYASYKNGGKTLRERPIEEMSRLTSAILRSIDYETIASTRISNYKFLEKYLASSNLIHLSLDEDAVPMVYPYLTNDENLRNRLIKHKIFVASYWPWISDDMSYEALLKQMLIPLPIDQRYGEKEMMQIINTILWK